MNEHLRKVVAHHDWSSETYDSDYLENFALYHKVTFDNMKRFKPKEKGSLILDAGGGTGIWSVELARLGYRIVLTDISEGMLKKAREKVKKLDLEDQIEMLVSDILSMPELPDNHFGMVICEGSPLSYCGDHRRPTAELVRVLEPGGRLIASVDGRSSALRWLGKSCDPEAMRRLLETGDVVRPTKRKDFRYVIHTFTPEELRELFESNGMSVERIIGKLVIADKLECIESDDPEIQEWLLRQELRYNDDPVYLPCAGHLEIVGRKK